VGRKMKVGRQEGRTEGRKMKRRKNEKKEGRKEGGKEGRYQSQNFRKEGRWDGFLVLGHPLVVLHQLSSLKEGMKGGRKERAMEVKKGRLPCNFTHGKEAKKDRKEGRKVTKGRKGRKKGEGRKASHFLRCFFFHSA
jgi:hypothetical protein